ncbi:DUF4350 domain-containing protein [Natronoglomus mannanivorans]|uniref:DUF4350 domain-containing protein n=1 Tax=Natronoglomus mannanivorans TaxID=2979990 RepID=A0AAP2Z2D0_9EURY|nr:DUF4350 domain-containing protein [Halobacteria archaeon AArc-xg1-1]
MKWEGGILEGFGLDWPQAVALALATVLVLALGVGAATSATDFGPYNPSWDGTSDLREELTADDEIDGTLIQDTSRYETAQANETVAFVVAPESTYEGEDRERVADFVDRGGTLVVLENFGEPGNDLLEGVGAQARVDGQLLRDTTEYAESTRMPIATSTGDHRLSNVFEQLTLNYASAIDPGTEPGDVTILARTSNHSYLGAADTDLEEAEDLRSYPVASIESVGNGTVVAVSDPSITVNAMYGEPDNGVFIRALYADAETVFLDYSHGDGIPPLVGAVLAFRGAPFAQLLVLASIIVACGLVSTGRLRPRAVVDRIRDRSSERPDTDTPTLSRADRIAFVEERYPEWDADRVERVVETQSRSRSDGQSKRPQRLNRTETEYQHE